MDAASEFSYCGLVAQSLRRLYNNGHDRDYSLAVINSLLAHRCQSKQVCATILNIISDDAVVDNTDAFVETLLMNKTTKDHCLALVFDLLTLLIKDGCYDSRSRVLIKRVVWYLRIKWQLVEDLEENLAEDLKSRQHRISQEEEDEHKSKTRSRKLKRYALIGLATVGGGALIGLTGGLAAPLLAAGAGAVIGGAGAAALGSAAGVAIIGSLFGVAGAGLTGYKMKRRVGATEEFEFEMIVQGGDSADLVYPRQLHITIAITGWLSSSMTDSTIPWSRLKNSHEQYSLRWESRYLVELGNALDLIMNWVASVAVQEALKYTVLSGLVAAIAWPATLVSAVGIIDNPWGVCVVRAKATGRELADVLLTRQQGKRPVTLIGYSLGARVIFYCLEELSKRKGCEGIIEDVIMLGAPVSANVSRWEQFSRVVAGKVINGYSRSDWLLKYLYRTTSAQLSVAGLESVRWEDRRMCNIDLSDLVSGHVDYRQKLSEILQTIGVQIFAQPDSDDFVILEASDDDMGTMKGNQMSHSGGTDTTNGDLKTHKVTTSSTDTTNSDLNSYRVTIGSTDTTNGDLKSHKVTTCSTDTTNGDLCDKTGIKIDL